MGDTRPIVNLPTLCMQGLATWEQSYQPFTRPLAGQLSTGSRRIDSSLRDLLEHLRSQSRGLIVVGEQLDPAESVAAVQIAEALSWPLAADSLSGEPAFTSNTHFRLPEFCSGSSYLKRVQVHIFKFKLMALRLHSAHFWRLRPTYSARHWQCRGHIFLTHLATSAVWLGVLEELTSRVLHQAAPVIVLLL